MGDGGDNETAGGENVSMQTRVRQQRERKNKTKQQATEHANMLEGRMHSAGGFNGGLWY